MTDQERITALEARIAQLEARMSEAEWRSRPIGFPSQPLPGEFPQERGWWMDQVIFNAFQEPKGQ